MKSQQLLRLNDEDLHAALSINSTSEEETERTAPESKNDSDLEGDFELDDETSDVDPDDIKGEDVDIVVHSEEGDCDPEHFFNQP